jgi:DDE superfamily endonuclease
MITNEGRDGQLARGRGYWATCRADAFRADFHAGLAARADELCELADAVLCAGGPMRSLAGLSLVAEHRRGHGALYDAVNCGRIESPGCGGP